MALTKVTGQGIDNVTVDSSGNVGIGTNSPSQEMHLYAGSGATDFLIEQGSTGNAYLHTKNSNREYLIGTGGDALKFYDLTADAERMSIDASGNVEINTGGLQARGVYNNTTGTGANLVVDSGGGFARSTSSQRYKNTITDATHGLTELLTLRPVTYKHNNDGDTI